MPWGRPDFAPGGQPGPEGGYAYDVALSISTDAGDTWQPALSAHTDGTPTEHGFVTLFPWQDAIGAVWLDGRNMVAGDASGDRPTDEIRDIFATRFVGGAWQAPAPVGGDGWHIDGCPVNGPAVDADGEAVVVAWFTAAADRPRVELAWSGNDGKTFGQPVEVDAERALGRVDVVLLADGDAIVSWLRSMEQGGSVSVRRVSSDGSRGPIRTVGQTSTSRPAGFPQMVAAGDYLVMSWTEVLEGSSRVSTARIALDAI